MAITFTSNPAADATFADLFSDDSGATWFKLWTGNGTEGNYVDTSAFNSTGNGWISAADLADLDIDFAQAGDNTLWVQTWDSVNGMGTWTSGTVDIASVADDMITETISGNVPLSAMFTAEDTGAGTWYQIWNGDAAGTTGAYLDTSAGNGWVTAEDLGNYFYQADAFAGDQNVLDNFGATGGDELWVRTWTPSSDYGWEHWSVDNTIDDQSNVLAGVDLAANVTGLAVDTDGGNIELVGAAPDGSFIDAGGDAGVAQTLRITGDADIRIDLSDPADQVEELDLNGDGVIDFDGVENDLSGSGTLTVSGFEVFDAYARNPKNHNDHVNNFFGDIEFDGTGFDGNGVNTDGNIFLGGLGSDVAYGGIGNDFLAGGGGGDDLLGGRNADFFFVEISALDPTDGDNLDIDGGITWDSSTAQNTDWVLVEASDDNEPVYINLALETITTDTVLDTVFVDIQNIENVDASGNLYGFLNNYDAVLGGAGEYKSEHAADGTENYGLGSSAQLVITGTGAANILVGGYDNDTINGDFGDDVLLGGNMQFLEDNQNNPNMLAITDDGRDELYGGAGDDDILFEMDGGIYEGAFTLDVDTAEDDTLWLSNYTQGASSNDLAEMTTDSVIRIDLGVGEEGVSGGFDNYAGYGGADEDATYADGNIYNTADQTNYAEGFDRAVVQDFLNVNATGLGAIDYDTDGTNDSELNFTGQMNLEGIEADLDLRGTVANNSLLANTGDDVLEGRQGDDILMGGDGTDTFIFDLTAGGDGLDQIKRMMDTGEEEGTVANDNIWDGVWGQDFGMLTSNDDGSSYLYATFPNSVDLTNPNVGVTQFEVTIDGAAYGADLTSAVLSPLTTTQDLANVINASFNAQNSDVTVEMVDNNTIRVVVADADAVIGVNLAQGTVIAGTAVGAPFQVNPTLDVDADSLSGDRLVFASYEDRADNELMDDDHDIDDVVEAGHTTTLGATNYAEDLVARFSDNGNYQEDGTTLTEGQSYTIDFENLNEQDEVSITVNGVTYTATVGLNPDGTQAVGDYTVAGDTAAGFVGRFAGLINSSDDDTQAGSITIAAAGETMTITQGIQLTGTGEDVYMDMPVVDVSDNSSNGEKAVATVTETSNTSVFLQDFDGTDGRLNSDNVAFVGDAGISRSIFETADALGGTLDGSEALGFDTIADADAIVDNYAHGDDLLFGAAGDDIINGLTGDDRIFASLGEDTLDGGKNHYVNVGDGAVQVLNAFEAAALNADADLTNNVAGVVNSVYSDTLVVQQADYGVNATFTIDLDAGLVSNPADADVLSDGVKGTVTYNEGVDDVTTFTNFEMIRTVSGNDDNIASDTLDLEAVSDAAAVLDDAVTYTMSTGAVTVNAVNYASIHGVENVIGGDADDTVIIDESEVGKENFISLGSQEVLGADTVAYDFTGYAFPASVAMTIHAESSDNVDTVDFSGPVLTGVFTDTLENVEIIDITQADVAARADDVLDVTAIDDAVVAFGVGADIQFSINGIDDDGADNILGNADDPLTNDTPADLLAAGGISTAATGAVEILTVNGITKLEIVNAGAGDDRIILVDNDSLENNNTDNSGLLNYGAASDYTFNMGSGTDTIDMRNETQGAVVAVGTGVDASDLLFYGDGGADALITVNSAEIYYGSIPNDNTIDMTLATVDTTIEYSETEQVADPNGLNSGETASFNNIQVSNTADGSVYANFVDTAAAGENWLFVTGSDFAENVILTDNESKLNHSFDLLGGANIVDYSAIEDVEPDLVDDSDAVNDAITLNVDSFQLDLAIAHTVGVAGTDAATELLEGYGTDTIRTDADSLTVIASAEADSDTITIAALDSDIGVIAGVDWRHEANVVNLSTGVVQEVVRFAADAIDTLEAYGAAVTDDVTTVVNTVNIENFENVVGSDTVDFITGNASANILDGGLGDDTIIAGGGDDIVIGDAGDDTLDGGAGADTITGGLGDDLIDGGTGDDGIDGGAGDDMLTGGAGDDIIADGTGSDEIVGGAGQDQITLTDDNTADRIVFTSFADSAYDAAAGNQGDEIVGFAAEDGVDLFEIHIDDGNLGTFVNADIVTAVAADLDGDTAADDNLVTIDVNGDATDDIEFALINDNGVTTLTTDDFVLAVDMSSGADAIDVSGITAQLELEYDLQTDSTLGQRDVINAMDFSADIFNFTDLNLAPVDYDAVPDGIQFDEVLRIDIPVSVDNASQMTGFFASNLDLDGNAATEDDILFVLQNEQGTNNYRLFVDVNQDGDFDQADDMVIDVTNEVDTNAVGIPVFEADILGVLGVTMATAFDGTVMFNV